MRFGAVVTRCRGLDSGLCFFFFPPWVGERWEDVSGDRPLIRLAVCALPSEPGMMSSRPFTGQSQETDMLPSPRPLFSTLHALFLFSETFQIARHHPHPLSSPISNPLFTIA